MDPEYEIWYRLLNCGIPLPASTGSDWFVCSNNRVYVDTGGGDTGGQGFDYDRWIDGLKAGRTFITNGPALFLRADGAAPGDTLDVQPDRELEVEIELKSHHRVDRIELVCNGAVVKRWHRPAGVAAETIRERFTPPGDGWIAARCYSHVRDSYDQEIFAHTSPIYLRCGTPNPAAKPDAAYFIDGIGVALDQWVSHKLRYGSDRQREEVRELFKRGRGFFEGV